jgi:hypothetical protein
MKTLLLIIIFLSVQVQAEDSFFIGDPLDLRKEAYNTVLNRFPDAELWIIQNYSREHWDEGCSQFGWIYLFIGSENGFEKDVRIKFDHAKQNDGTCKYIARKDPEVKPNQVVGIMRLNLDKVQIRYEDALVVAQKAINLPFKVWWAKLVTPLHPAATGRIFWNFKGPVECNKGAELTIDASTGQLEKKFSIIPNCP